MEVAHLAKWFQLCQATSLQVVFLMSVVGPWEKELKQVFSAIFIFKIGLGRDIFFNHAFNFGIPLRVILTLSQEKLGDLQSFAAASKDHVKSVLRKHEIPGWLCDFVLVWQVALKNDNLTPHPPPSSSMAVLMLCAVCAVQYSWSSLTIATCAMGAVNMLVAALKRRRKLEAWLVWMGMAWGPEFFVTLMNSGNCSQVLFAHLVDCMVVNEKLFEYLLRHPSAQEVIGTDLMEEAQRVLIDCKEHTTIPPDTCRILQKRTSNLVRWCVLIGFLHLLIDHNLDLPVLKPLMGFLVRCHLDLFHLPADQKKNVEIAVTLTAATLFAMVLEWLARQIYTYYILLLVGDIVFSIWLGKDGVFRVGSCFVACVVVEIVGWRILSSAFCTRRTPTASDFHSTAQLLLG